MSFRFSGWGIGTFGTLPAGLPMGHLVTVLPVVVRRIVYSFCSLSLGWLVSFGFAGWGIGTFGTLPAGVPVGRLVAVKILCIIFALCFIYIFWVIEWFLIGFFVICFCGGEGIMSSVC